MSQKPTQSLVDPLSALTARGMVWRGTSGAQVRAISSGIHALDQRLPGGGWPLGALSELLIPAHGIGELSLMLPAAAKLTQSGQVVAFIAPPQLPYAPALAQAGLDLSRTLIIEPQPGGQSRKPESSPNSKTAEDGKKECAKESIWAAEQLLRAPICGLVALWALALSDSDTRRLQLAAEAGNSVALLYRPARAAGSASVAALRMALHVMPEPVNHIDCHAQDGEFNGQPNLANLEIELLKVRGGRAGARFRLADGATHSSASAGTSASRRA
jgi:protein ImuA